MHLQHAMVFRRADRVGYLSVNRRELHPTRAESFHDLAKVRVAGSNLLGGRFLMEFYAMVARWAEWATGIVEDWPDPRLAEPDPTAMEESVRLAESIAAIDRT